MSTAIEKRVARIETKLTRLSISLGMEMNGNPPTAIVIDQDLFLDLIGVLDNALCVVDTLDTEHKHDELGDSIEALYNRMITLRNARWPPNNSTS